jgi:hypothetical protein
LVSEIPVDALELAAEAGADAGELVEGVEERAAAGAVRSRCKAVKKQLRGCKAAAMHV